MAETYQFLILKSGMFRIFYELPIIKVNVIQWKNRQAVNQVNSMYHGKRTSKVISLDKETPELIKSKIKNDLVLGIHGINPIQCKLINLNELIQTYLDTK